MQLNAYDAWFRLPAQRVIELWLHGENLKQDTEAETYERLATEIDHHAALAGMKSIDIKSFTRPLYNYARTLRRGFVDETHSPREEVLSEDDEARRRFYGLAPELPAEDTEADV